MNDVNKERLYHEIYMSDARKVALEKWKTVIRHPIKKHNKSYLRRNETWHGTMRQLTIEKLQEAILEKMRKNGPVTDYMLGTVRENTHHGSLITWVKSFI